jgi:undecaprenyl phosphate-alpha-L-ara4N flippase subunit ArnE
MFRLIILSLIQSILMCSCQSFFKVAATHMAPFSWTWTFFRDSVLLNWWLAAAGVCGIVGVVEWMYMLKTYPFSQVYPLSSMSFLLGMFVAIIFFKETVVWQQWVGVFLILAGCGLIAR